MDIWIYINFAVFMLVVVLAGFIIPQILLIAFRKKLFDEVDSRKIHHGTVPRLGGIAFFPVILFAIVLFLGVGRLYAPGLVGQILPSSITSLCFIICSIIIIFLVGMADDLIGVKYRAKFIAQILSAALIIIGGIHIDSLHGFVWVSALPPIFAILLTVLLTVFIINAINLIDGIDGLASGLSAMACLFYGYIFTTCGLHIYAILAFATLGALVPFFYYNVFGNAKKRRKIFMGDTGALTVGLILSILSIRICQIGDDRLDINPAVVAFAPLLIPGFDVVRVYLHRIKAHHNPFLPDKTHIHHKLLALGLNQRVAMPIIICWSCLLTLLNYWAIEYVGITWLFLADLALWIIINTILSRAVRRRQRRTGIILYQ